MSSSSSSSFFVIQRYSHTLYRKRTRLTILAAFQNCTPLMTCFMNMIGPVTAATSPGKLVLSMIESAHEMAAMTLG